MPVYHTDTNPSQNHYIPPYCGDPVNIELTHQQREQLYDLGFSKFEVDALEQSPDLAEEILRQLDDVPYVEDVVIRQRTRSDRLTIEQTLRDQQSDYEGSDSISMLIADMECARRLANILFEPPIEEKEIEDYADMFKISKKQAEGELRRSRQ